jgi:hypothetical protein
VNVVTNISLSRGDGTPHSCQPNGLGAGASRCGSRLARIGSHSWDSGRLIAVAALLVPMVTLTLSVIDGLVDTVECCCCPGWPPWHCPLLLVVCIVPMATMALSVMAVDGHNGTVNSLFASESKIHSCGAGIDRPCSCCLLIIQSFSRHVLPLTSLLVSSVLLLLIVQSACRRLLLSIVVVETHSCCMYCCSYCQ